VTGTKIKYKDGKVGRLEGKVAVITGAGSGMGRAAAILFAKAGAKVVVADWVAEWGQETVRMVKEAGGKATFINVDVSKEEDIKNMIKTAVDTYGKLNVLYNNAGVFGEVKSTVEISGENFDNVIAINLKGVWLGMKYAIPEMLKAGGGSIINIASIAADVAQRCHTHYAASKGGIVSLSRVAALEYADKNIRVNCINPGPIETPLMLSLMEDPEASKRFLSAVPQGRLAKPEEIAYAALFLASDECPFMTGQAMVIDGGSEADSHMT